MVNEIHENSKKGTHVLVALGVLFTGVFTVGAAAYFLGIVGAVGTGISFFASVMWLYANAERMVFRSSGAVRMQVTPDLSRVEGCFLADAAALAKRAGFADITLAKIESPQANAFGLGSSRKDARIIITSGLLTTLSRAEAACVIAHELGHIQAGDNRGRAFASLIGMGLHALICPLLGKKNDYTGTRSGAPKQVSRRDHRADAFAARLCGDPAALASALEKLDRSARANILERVNNAPFLAPFCTVDPFKWKHVPTDDEFDPTAYRVAEIYRLQMA